MTVEQAHLRAQMAEELVAVQQLKRSLLHSHGGNREVLEARLAQKEKALDALGQQLGELRFSSTRPPDT